MESLNEIPGFLPARCSHFFCGRAFWKRSGQRNSSRAVQLIFLIVYTKTECEEGPQKWRKGGLICHCSIPTSSELTNATNDDYHRHHQPRAPSPKANTRPHHVIERLLSISNFQTHPPPQPHLIPQHSPLWPHLVSSTQQHPALAPNRLPKCTPFPSPRKIQLQRLTSRAGVSERANERKTDREAF
jgi:hypothetical protein